MLTKDKVRENRLRRIAARRGFILKRSRRRDPQALDYGKYWLIDARTNALVYPKLPASAAEWGTELDDVELYLNSYVRK